MNILFVVWICFVSRTLANVNYMYDELEPIVESQCIEHCPFQNRSDTGHYDYVCDYTCKVKQCTKGCKLWKKTFLTKVECKDSCNISSFPSHKDLHCVLGCNDALAKYLTQVRSHLGTLPAPALVADSLGSSSLKLEWNFPEAKRTGLTIHVQWKDEETPNWQYCANATWIDEENKFLIEGLRPYTKYRFLVSLNLDKHGDQILSMPSVGILTNPGGIPESSPKNDIPPDITYYIVRDLKSSTNYSVEVEMRNARGSGPAAKSVVSTPPEPKESYAQQPVVLLGTAFSVFELTHILGEPVYIYHSTVSLQGIAIHATKKLLFVSDVRGYVSRMTIKQEAEDVTYILTPEQIDFMPLDLSVDWLNNQLYILGEVKDQRRYIIKRCNLDGSGLTVAFAGLNSRPAMIQIDPFNGFLFWTVDDTDLYRLDISDISNGIKHEGKEKRILREYKLGAFIVDYTNYRLLISHESKSTIISVSLDGKETSNLRPNVTNSQLSKVISLATANNMFYWTDGGNVFYEEYFQKRKSYFHNKISHLVTSSYKKVFVNLPSSQPWPTPLNPPTNVQAIFGSNIANARWQPPHLLGVQGKGAWQNWSYEVFVEETKTNTVKIYKNINTTSFTIINLKENTEYYVKVAAYTDSGRGPWSSKFTGITLSNSKNPLLLWSTPEGLLKSNTAGEDTEMILYKDEVGDAHFTDVSWYEDQVYLISNTSHVYWYNLTSQKKGRLSDIDSVGSIAVDWIGRKLYWSNPKQQLIIRGNLNGSQQEPLPILTVAKELNIDSVKAYLYWSTEYVVECAHLNGADRIEYHHVELFSGKQVMGLTLDTDQKFVYWIVRGSDGSNLLRAKMAGYSSDPLIVERVTLLQKTNIQGPLSYFHKRLLWLQDDEHAAISDLTGKNVAIITGKSMSELNLVYVVDDSLHLIPEHFDSASQINVIPEVIDKLTVKVEGSSESFNITWDPIQNVNYGTVFYEVQVDSLSKNDSTVITTEPTVRYWREVTPFTQLQVVIRAFTYWGTSPQIKSIVYSPPSTPSKPRNIRTYVAFEKTGTMDRNYATVTFRWDPPLHPNGVLQGYLIRCWYKENDVEIDICDDVKLPPHKQEYIIKELEENEIYYFQVQAYTEIGLGTVSVPISINSSYESPPPTLLMALSDAILLTDIDANRNHSIIDGITTPMNIGYLMKENKVLWIDKNHELLMYDFVNSNKTKLIDIDGYPKGLTVDWLERSLYYVESPDVNISRSVVFKVDLNQIEKNIAKKIKVLETKADISKIEVSPFTKKLYWTETMDGLVYNLLQSNADGSEISTFISQTNYNYEELNEESCNCSFKEHIERTFTLDHSRTDIKPLLIFVDSIAKSVISSDKYGCFCNVIANNTIMGDSFPVNNIKCDFGNIYWTNPKGLLYAMQRKESNLLIKNINVHDILIYGQHMQPYPPKKCLSPIPHANFTVSLKHKTSNCFSLKMPQYKIYPECQNTSLASVLYTVFYKEYDENESDDCSTETCKELQTFDTELEVHSLKPFTKYVISVAVSNYYTNNDEIVIGPSVILQSGPGAPSSPRNVSGLVLNPTLAKVNWLPPKELNGNTTRYEIHWQTEGSLTGIRQKGEQPVINPQYVNNTEILTTLLHKLNPNETYTISVKAYSETNEASPDSNKIQITTYPEPPNIVLLDKSAYTLKLNWEIAPNVYRYALEYAPITFTNEWRQISDIQQTNDTVFAEVKNLKPKTQYKFRLLLLYQGYSDLYIWPTDSRLTFETLGDRPSPPGIPIIQYVKPNIYKVWWEASKENGSPVEMYILEALKLRSYRTKRSTNRTSPWFESSPSIEIQELSWEQVYNGTDTSWIMDGLNDKYKYVFRVSSLNSYGWSDYSEESMEFDLNEAARMAEKQSPLNLLLIAICVPILICLVVVAGLLYLMSSGKCGKQKKVQVVPIPRGPDVELATLRELPRRGVHSTNILYVPTTPTFEEITKLPHIGRDQITLTKFLGSGAFGEVYEGKARAIEGDVVNMKVAVKTLKKGASDQEKSEFLQEAQLMSHFKHEHILELLGVCLDNDPHFIIMELMEGGDLLTYLRDSRNPASHTPLLTLIELLKMCVDVSKGCKYLEEMHFVHRDLACRNCLVSSIESGSRIVKIGDFGLARDIYKNDYYRKEGEGLLPVRWMAPESLVDGVFTSQSDVWAFGVLLWEIMTLGQQPYPARNNLEVLHYVRRGGRLGKPVDCPEDLYNLMLLCWDVEPDKRPTFKYCLDVLENLHRHSLRNPTTGAHEGQYISTVPESSSWKSDTEEDPNREKSPFLPTEPNTTAQEIPKYLELVYEPESPVLENDGYEIPNQVFRNNLSDSLKLSSLSKTSFIQKDILANEVPNHNDNETPYKIMDGSVNAN